MSDCATDADKNYFFPAATLGLGPTDQNGFLIDAWGNRIRYQVTDATYSSSAWIFTRANGMKTAGMSNLNAELAKAPTIEICLTSSCGASMTKEIVAVIVSTGKNGAAVTVGPDEIENRNGDKRFVSRPQGTDGSGNFDDQLVWLSASILYSKLMAAGQPLAAEPIP